MSEADKAYSAGCILVYAKDLERENAELKRIIAESKQMKPVGYLYLEEGGYNHEEKEKFSKEKPLMGMSNNLTVITEILYASPPIQDGMVAVPVEEEHCNCHPETCCHSWAR